MYQHLGYYADQAIVRTAGELRIQVLTHQAMKEEAHLKDIIKDKILRTMLPTIVVSSQPVLHLLTTTTNVLQHLQVQVPKPLLR